MDHFHILCPWCGEPLEIAIEADVAGTMIQDCEVCCQPMQLTIRRDGWGDPDIDVDQA
jgi:hypothetical protein